MQTETKHPAHRRIERANAQDAETHRGRVTLTTGGRYAVTAPSVLPMMLSATELQGLVDDAYQLGISPRLWMDAQ